MFHLILRHEHDINILQRTKVVILAQSRDVSIKNTRVIVLFSGERGFLLSLVFLLRSLPPLKSKMPTNHFLK